MAVPPIASPQAMPAEARRVEALATRLETPCGDGSMVWHSWGSGKPVVLLHGGSGSWTHWLRNVEALAATGRRVLAADLPGFGDSALPPAGTDADSLPEPVEEGLRHLLGDEPCDLVGFSFGSMVAGFIAQRFPQRAKRLVIVGAPGMGLWAGRQTLDLTPWRHLSDPARRREIHRHNLGILMLHDAAAIDDLAVALQGHNVERDRTRGRSIARTDALLRTLREVACPVFAIYGEHDALYVDRMAQLRELLGSVAQFRGFTQVEGGGHWVQFEKAGAFNEALAAALDQPA